MILYRNGVELIVRLQRRVYTGSVLLYRDGILSVRAVVRGAARWEGNPAQSVTGLGATDRQRNALSPHA